MNCQHCEATRVLAEERKRPVEERCFDTIAVAGLNAAKPCTDKTVWAKRFRDSETFGKGSCTTVDEAMEDSELLEALNDYDTFEEAWGTMCDIEETHWDRCNIAWKRPEGIK